MLSVALNQSKLIASSFGGVLVIMGVVMKNSLEQLKINNEMGEKLGKFMFVLGWALTAYSISLKGSRISFSLKSLLATIASTLIVVAVFMMKKLMKEEKEMNMIYPIMFMSSWVLLGGVVGLGGDPMGYVGGLLASALVIGSMIFILPKQRELGVVDGPGMPMFTLAWVLLTCVNVMIH
jgi:hypothetical protein